MKPTYEELEVKVQELQAQVVTLTAIIKEPFNLLNLLLEGGRDYSRKTVDDIPSDWDVLYPKMKLCNRIPQNLNHFLSFCRFSMEACHVNLLFSHGYALEVKLDGEHGWFALGKGKQPVFTEPLVYRVSHGED